MFRYTAMIIILMLLGCCFSCGNSSENQIQDAGSVSEPFDYKAIGITRIPEKDVASLGTLITPDLVISDAHTFCEPFASPENCSYRATFEVLGLNEPIGGDVYIHPMFSCKDVPGSGVTCHIYADIALIKLDRPIDSQLSITPMAVERPYNRIEHSISQPVKGDKCTLVSTLNFDQSNDDGTPILANLKTIKYEIDDAENIDFGISFRDKERLPTDGDSGGPLINQDGHIIGVAHGGSSRIINYTPVYLYNDWLASHIAISLFNESSKKCMEVGGWNWKENANISQWDCHGDTNQLWTYEYVNPVEFTLVSLENGLCLDVRDWSMEEGANIQQYACYKGNNQLWRKELPTNFESAGYYQIVSVNSGKVLSVNSSENGAYLIQRTYQGLSSQHWKISVPMRLIAGHSDKCIEVGDGSEQDGSNVNQWECTGSSHQLWVLEKAFQNNDRYYSIVSLDSGKCIENGNNNIYQQRCSYSDRQLWWFLRRPDGSFQLLPECLGCAVVQYINVENDGASNGNNVILGSSSEQSFFGQNPIDSLYFIMVHDGKYVYAMGSNTNIDVYTTKGAESFNAFKIIDFNHLALKDNDILSIGTWLYKKYIGAVPGLNDGEMNADWDYPNSWSKFRIFKYMEDSPSSRIIMHNSKISLKTETYPQSYYIMEEAGKIKAKSIDIDSSEIFTLKKVDRFRKNFYHGDQYYGEQ